MSPSKKRNEDKTEHKLREWFSGVTSVAIAGIGNPLRRDDFVGVKIVRSLHGNVSSSVYLIECETVPENFIDQIIKFDPSHVLIIDAALLNLASGCSKLFSPDQLVKQQAVSSHALPLRIFCGYLARETNARIALLLIQPEDTSFGEGLTPKLQDTAEWMARLLSRFLSA